MIYVAPQIKILVAFEPADFRRSIDGLVAICRDQLQQNPYSGCVFLFRNRARTAIRLLSFDGSGFWLCMKRMSTGKFQWWPEPNGEPLTTIAAKELMVLLYNGDPTSAKMAEDWRKL
jgi:hypothetical protein